MTLTKHIEDLLSKNLNFYPKPSHVDEAELDHSLKKFGSKLIWKEFHSSRVIDSEDEEQPYSQQFQGTSNKRIHGCCQR